MDLGEVKSGVLEEGLRRVPKEGFRLPGGGVDQGGVDGVLPLLHPRLVDLAGKCFQDGLKPGPLLLQLGLVLNVQHHPPHRRVL